MGHARAAFGSRPAYPDREEAPLHRHLVAGSARGLNPS